MNCEVFQSLRFDYLDDMLSESERRAAREHFTDCRECRDSIEREERLAELLRSGFQARVDSLAADPDLAQRVTASVQSPDRPAAAGIIVRFPMLFRFSAAAAVLFAIGIGLFLKRPVTPTVADPQAVGQITIELSYCAPNYVFQRSGGYVVDALTCESNTVTGTLFSKID